MSVKKDTSVWDKIKKGFNANTKLSVGFFDTYYGPENDNLPVAYIASIQDQGLGVPMRPFLSGANGLAGALRSRPYAKDFALSIARILEGKSTFAQEYASVGKFLVKDTKDFIDDWSTPPNAPLTVALKGFNDPLIESGTMRDSVEYRIEKDN